MISAKEARQAVEEFKENKKLLKMLDIANVAIESEAKKGLSSVLISYEEFHPSADDKEAINRLNLVMSTLREKGFVVIEYSESDVEYGCFGASAVAVNGIEIKW